MSVAFVEELVVENQVGIVEAGLEVTKSQRNALVDVALGAVVVNARLGSGKGFFDRSDGW